MTTAVAPFAPLIIPGRPPKTEEKNPTMTALQRPERGEMSRRNENMMACGMIASIAVRPEKMFALVDCLRNAPTPSKNNKSFAFAVTLSTRLSLMRRAASRVV